MSLFHKMLVRGGFAFALVSTDTTQNNTNSPSFSNMAAGNANGGRVLIAVITAFDDAVGDSTFWPATCTIGGVTATRRAFTDQPAGPSSIGAAVYSVIVPSGITATVSITVAFSGIMDDWACALFRATSVSATPVDTDQDTTDVTLDTSAAKFAVFGCSEEVSINTSWAGGGNPTVAVVHDKMIIGYDDAPLGGATDTYTVDVDGDAFAGAAFG